MGRDLLAVLVPMGLIAYWALITVLARDNRVISPFALFRIIQARAEERIRVRIEANIEPFRRAYEEMARRWSEFAGQIQESIKESDG